MSAYRKHGDGISVNVTKNLMKKDFNIIPWILQVNMNFPKYQYKSFTYEKMMILPKDLNYYDVLKYYFLFAFYSFSYFPNNLYRIYTHSLVPINFLRSKMMIRTRFNYWFNNEK